MRVFRIVATNGVRTQLMFEVVVWLQCLREMVLGHCDLTYPMRQVLQECHSLSSRVPGCWRYTNRVSIRDSYSRLEVALDMDKQHCALLTLCYVPLTHVTVELRCIH